MRVALRPSKSQLMTNSAMMVRRAKIACEFEIQVGDDHEQERDQPKDHGDRQPDRSPSAVFVLADLVVHGVATLASDLSDALPVTSMSRRPDSSAIS